MWRHRALTVHWQLVPARPVGPGRAFAASTPEAWASPTSVSAFDHLSVDTYLSMTHYLSTAAARLPFAGSLCQCGPCHDSQHRRYALAFDVSY